MRAHVVATGMLLGSVLAPGPTAAAQELGVSQIAAEHLSAVSPGMVVALARDGEVVFLEAYGRLHDDEFDPMRASTAFPSPGLTEFLLTGTLYALAEGGQLDLDGPLARLVPALEPPLAGVTLRQLLSHTAGLDDAEPRDGWSWDRLLGDVDEDWFFAEPGKARSFSRYSLPLAAAFVERATHRPVEELVGAALLDALEMDMSTFDLEVARAHGLATGYRPSNRPRRSAEEVELRPTRLGIPVLFTTATDVVKLLSAWEQGRIRGTHPLDEVPTEVAEPPGDGAYVAGFHRSDFRGEPRVRKVESAFGISTVMEVLPRRGIVVVAWSPGAPPTRTATFALNRVADALGLAPAPLPGDPEARASDAPATGGGEVSDLSSLAGTYLNGDREIVLRPFEGGVAFFDGVRDLPIRRNEDGALWVWLPEGRPVLPLHVARDGDGTLYLYRGNRAFRRQEG